jgi:2-phosphosulfolactate phosphatase
MRIIVDGGRQGAHRAAAEGNVAVIVDALRASATTASFLQWGVRDIIVVEDLEAAFAEAKRRPGALLAGERGGVRVEGFDLGNSPLSEPRTDLSPTIVFSSSNMSRCCVGAATAPAVFLGSTVNCRACAERAWLAARQEQRDLRLVPAGSVLDESKLVAEDYIACGALIAVLWELSGGEALPSGDAAQAAMACYSAAVARETTEAFLATDNGVDLCALGFEADVRFASQRDVLDAVPQVVRTYELPDGGVAAVLSRAE